MSRPALTSRVSATHNLARTANLKLRKEASLPQHRLRFLVCHANMLDAITLNLAEIQQRQIEYTNYLKVEEERLIKNPSAIPTILENIRDSQTYATGPNNTHQRKADSFASSTTEDRETSPSTSAFTSKIISQIGYDLQRTLSRRANENAGSETGFASASSGSENARFSDNLSSQDQLRPRHHVTFENPVVMKVYRVQPG